MKVHGKDAVCQFDSSESDDEEESSAASPSLGYRVPPSARACSIGTTMGQHSPASLACRSRSSTASRRTGLLWPLGRKPE